MDRVDLGSRLGAAQPDQRNAYGLSSTGRSNASSRGYRRLVTERYGESFLAFLGLTSVYGSCQRGVF